MMKKTKKQYKAIKEKENEFVRENKIFRGQLKRAFQNEPETILPISSACLRDESYQWLEDLVNGDITTGIVVDTIIGYRFTGGGFILYVESLDCCTEQEFQEIPKDILLYIGYCMGKSIQRIEFRFNEFGLS